MGEESEGFFDYVLACEAGGSQDDQVVAGSVGFWVLIFFHCCDLREFEGETGKSGFQKRFIYVKEKGFETY